MRERIAMGQSLAFSSRRMTLGCIGIGGVLG